MKKLVLVLITLLLVLTGCGNGNGNAADSDYKVGSYSLTSFKPKDATADADGSIQFNTTIVTVLLDGDVVKDVKIDVAQNTAVVKADGAVEVPSEFPTKQEKGDAYGMKGASESAGRIEGGAEWYEQIASLREWMIGRTVSDIVAMDTEERDPSHTAVPTVEELTSSVTITVGDYLSALEKAAETAVAVEGTPAELGAASITTMTHDPENGRVQTETYYSHLVLDADGKVLSSFIDCAQNRVVVAEDGTITGEPIDSKYVLKEGYNMKDTSANIGNIEGGAEWYEQADSFNEHVKGMTVEEITSMALTDGAPDDLTTSVTVTISGWLANFEKAADQATKVE